MSRPWSQTSTGRRFHFTRPDDSIITILDIARPLSRIPRFNGAGNTDMVISVAEHSVAVSCVVESRYACRVLSLAALLHDASEAYMNDISTPQKSLPDMEGYRIREAATMRAIEARFFLANGALSDPRIKVVDLDCLATEARLTYTKLDPGWEEWIAGCRGVDGSEFTYQGLDWRDTEDVFLSRFNALGGR